MFPRRGRRKCFPVALYTSTGKHFPRVGGTGKHFRHVHLQSDGETFLFNRGDGKTFSEVIPRRLSGMLPRRPDAAQYRRGNISECCPVGPMQTAPTGKHSLMFPRRPDFSSGDGETF